MTDATFRPGELDGWLELSGRSLSPGVFVGRAHILDGSAWLEAGRRARAAGSPDAELERLRAARTQAGAQLQRVEAQLARQGRRSDAEIFGAHRALLNDPILEERIEMAIRGRGLAAEAALVEVIEATHRDFSGNSSPMVQDKAADVLDAGQRWLRSLNPVADVKSAGGTPTVLVAASLTPSELVSFAHAGPCAAVTQECGTKSHVAILARSLGVPLVSGIAWPPANIVEGAHVLVDGGAGVVRIAPAETSDDEIEAIRTALVARQPRAQTPRQPRTLDGVPIQLSLNISAPSEAAYIDECGAAGVGLFRTEFVYMGRDSWPSEDDSHAAYAQVAAAVGDGVLHIRLADFGADKCPSYADFPIGRNPSLGLRGVRLLLERDDILAPQLRAIARIATLRPTLLLVPVLDGLDTLHAFNAAVERICGLSRAAFPFSLGAMIEVPAAALTIEALLEHVDHVSIGLNDLTQYVMAADREEEAVERYHDPLTPAVLGLVDRVVSAAHAWGRGVSVCGELAGAPALTRVLIAFGIRELSVSRADYFRVVEAVENLSTLDLTDLADRIRRAKTAHAIRELCALG